MGGLLPLKPKHLRQASINAATKEGRPSWKLASPGPGDIEFLLAIHIYITINLWRCGRDPRSEVALAKSRQEEKGAGNWSWCEAQCWHWERVQDWGQERRKREGLVGALV